MWCWAASGQMVMETFGKNVSQCDEANKRFGQSNCCNSPTPEPCIQGGWPEFDKYGFTFETTSNAPLSWDDLRKEIGVRKNAVRILLALEWWRRSYDGRLRLLNCQRDKICVN
jgi:hypothetical protein